MEAQVGALTAPAPGGFDKASDTDASIGPPCRRRLPPGLKAVPVGHFKRLVNNRCEIAAVVDLRSEEHTSELQSLMRTSYDVFCLKQENKKQETDKTLSTQQPLIYTIRLYH